MHTKLGLGVSVAAGFFGGMLYHYVSSASTHAQNLPPPIKVISAQEVVLQDDVGHTAARLSILKDGRGHIQLFDGHGRQIWQRPFSALNREIK